MSAKAVFGKLGIMAAAAVLLVSVTTGGSATVDPHIDEAQHAGFSANDTDFLNMMGNLEGPRGFGTISDFAPALPDRDIRELSIEDVLIYQRQIRTMGTQSSAVGRYQFIYKTLLDIVSKNEISMEMIFDEEMQTYLARMLMSDCGFYDVDTDIDQLGNCLAGRWAALPLLSGPGRGYSAYRGDGMNNHLIDAQAYRAVLETRFLW